MRWSVTFAAAAIASVAVACGSFDASEQAEAADAGDDAAASQTPDAAALDGGLLADGGAGRCQTVSGWSGSVEKTENGGSLSLVDDVLVAKADALPAGAFARAARVHSFDLGGKTLRSAVVHFRLDGLGSHGFAVVGCSFVAVRSDTSFTQLRLEVNNTTVRLDDEVTVPGVSPPPDDGPKLFDVPAQVSADVTFEITNDAATGALVNAGTAVIAGTTTKETNITKDVPRPITRIDLECGLPFTRGGAYSVTVEKVDATVCAD